MDCSEFFLFLLSQGQLLELSRLGKLLSSVSLQKRYPGEQHPRRRFVPVFLPSILLEIQHGFTVRKKFKFKNRFGPNAVLPFPEEPQRCIVLAIPHVSAQLRSAALTLSTKK